MLPIKAIRLKVKKTSGLKMIKSVFRAMIAYKGKPQKKLTSPSERNSLFCIVPYIHLSLRADGPTPYFSSCCYASEGIRHAKGGKFIRVGDCSAETAFNSQTMRKIRSDLAAGIWPKTCSGLGGCKEREDLTGTSFRKIYNDKWLSELNLSKNELVKKAAENNWNVDYRPAWVSMSLGNTCNLACRTCGPSNSSQTLADPVQRNWSENKNLVSTYVNRKTTVTENDLLFSNQEDAYLDMIGTPENLRQLYLTGGEPMLIPATHKLLKSLLANGAHKSTRLVMNTNATIAPDSVLALLSKFPHLHLGLSIDGTEATFEYIRYPAKWEVALKVIQKLRQKLPHAAISITPTISLYNLDNAIDLFSFARSNNLYIDQKILRRPNFLSPFILPKPILLSYAERFSNADMNSISLELTKPSNKIESNQIQNFITYTNDLDAYRKQKFDEVAPTFIQSLSSEGIEWNYSRKVETASHQH